MQLGCEDVIYKSLLAYLEPAEIRWCVLLLGHAPAVVQHKDDVLRRRRGAVRAVGAVEPLLFIPDQTELQPAPCCAGAIRDLVNCSLSCFGLLRAISHAVECVLRLAQSPPSPCVTAGVAVVVARRGERRERRQEQREDCASVPHIGWLLGSGECCGLRSVLCALRSVLSERPFGTPCRSAWKRSSAGGPCM